MTFFSPPKKLLNFIHACLASFFGVTYSRPGRKYRGHWDFFPTNIWPNMFFSLQTALNSLHKNLEMSIFGLKMLVKSGLEFLKFEIEPAPISAHLPGQFSLSERACSISIKKTSRPLTCLYSLA